MSQDPTPAGLRGPVGVVTVAGLEITITPLSLADERALERSHSAAAAKVGGDLYTRLKPELDAMKVHDREAYALAIARIVETRATTSGPTPSQYREYWETPGAMARELYFRGKAATPGLTLDGLLAIVTANNMDDVDAQLRGVLAPAPKASIPQPSPGPSTAGI